MQFKSYAHPDLSTEIVDVIREEDVTKSTKRWFEGQYGFVLVNMIKLNDPVPIQGSIGLWKLTGKDFEKCLAQLPTKKRKEITDNVLN